MNTTKQIKTIQFKVKKYFFRILVFVLMMYSVLINTSIFNLDSKAKDYIFVPMFLLLWMIFELVIKKEDQNHTKKTDFTLIKWTEALPKMIDATRSATSTIDILGSSTESIFLAIKDIIEKKENICIRVILRKKEEDNNDRGSKLKLYHNYWKSLNCKNRNVKVEVKFHSSDVLRAIIIDKSISFLGFYKMKDGKFWGHSVPVMYFTNDSYYADYFVSIYINRFEQLWEDGHE